MMGMPFDWIWRMPTEVTWAWLALAESKVKELVEEGKVGFPEVQKVIESLTDEGGKFGGLMEAQSKTITGQISNIEDAVSMMLNEIGQ